MKQIRLFILLITGACLMLGAGNLRAQVVDIELEPDAITVAQGDVAVFTMSLTNTTDEMQHVRFTATVETPEGDVFELRRTRPIWLPPGFSITLEPAIYVPSSAPTGDYILTVGVTDMDDGLIDSDFIVVTVTEAESLTGYTGGEWKIRGFME